MIILYGQEVFDKQMLQIKIVADKTKELYLKCYNGKKEYSIWRIRLNRDTVRGNGFDDPFLYRTTGWTED